MLTLEFAALAFLLSGLAAGLLGAATLKQALDLAIQAGGYTAVAEHLGALVGWQAKWYRQDQAARIGEAARLILQAADILRPLEAEEAIDEMS